MPLGIDKGKVTDTHLSSKRRDVVEMVLVLGAMILRKGQPEMNRKMRVWDWVTEKELRPAAGSWNNVNLAEVFLEVSFL
ncbi:hypothetical protein L208DRAFT_1387963 [Tricholoma matsutake]|nr:hypothetical protein L208DRAFT_1387963 [Tricholoma matsutake 945]